VQNCNSYKNAQPGCAAPQHKKLTMRTLIHNSVAFGSENWPFRAPKALDFETSKKRHSLKKTVQKSKLTE
jgi:hypothetical protein